MKKATGIILFVIISSLFSVCSATNRTNALHSFKVEKKKYIFSEQNLKLQKPFRFNFDDNAGEILSLMEATLFVTGVVMYLAYDSDNFLNMNQYSYRNTGLILMGISLGGGFIQVLGSSGYYGGDHYGPRSSIPKKQHFQLSFNGQALGLRMNF